MMDSHELRAPQLWRRPHAKIYSYNQDFSANYYSVERSDIRASDFTLYCSLCWTM